MVVTKKKQRTFEKLAQADHLLTWAEGFLTFCESQLITQVTEITPQTLREYLLALDSKGHNPGGIHAHYRVLITFLYWWEDEVEPEGWKNPVRKVKAPRVGIEPLEPANMVGDYVKQLPMRESLA